MARIIKPNFDKRPCVTCGSKYKPTTFLDKYCPLCKSDRKAKRVRSDPWKGIDKEGSRGEAVKCTPTAIKLDRAVARRVEKMK